ncbi:MAG: hypothetical protein ACI845_003014 [Gammaproteobacteria bacterium]|jgi:hypothetical protein
MSAQKRLNSAAWQRLETELQLWEDQEKIARFWWRDDDACEQTEQLERLFDLSHQNNVPLSIAVIPQRLKECLVDYCQDKPGIQVLQHGFAHKSHAAAGQKKIELGGQAKHDEILTDLRTGKTNLKSAFQNQFIPVLVPPWNRMDESLINRLPETGYCGLSTMWARHVYELQPNFRQINTHLDPVLWRPGPSFIGEPLAIALLIQHLAAKRTGYRDEREATGILTHHLVQNDQVWAFCDKLFDFLSRYPNVEWMSAKQIWVA